MEDIIKIGLRIKEERLRKGITQEELGKLLGMNKSTIQRYETGKIEKIKLPILENIAFILNVNPSYLALKTDDRNYYGENTSAPGSLIGEIASTSTECPLPSNVFPITTKRFPLLGKIACGEPIFTDEDHESFIMADADIKADFCLVAEGDSMINARINNGDVVFIRKQPTVNNGEIAAVIIGNEATLKRVYYYPEKHKLVLNAENPAYEPFVYMYDELDTITIVGKAVCFMSNL